MKKILPIMLLWATVTSCSKSNQPKCSDNIVQSTLKEICAKSANRDTSEISVSAVRTISKNKEFNSCECQAKIEAQGKVFSFLYLNAIDGDINYTAQLTDDGKNINVTIKE